MAPRNQKTKFAGKEGDLTKTGAQDVKKKRKWIPEHKVFKGSVNEGKEDI